MSPGQPRELLPLLPLALAYYIADQSPGFCCSDGAEWTTGKGNETPCSDQHRRDDLVLRLLLLPLRLTVDSSLKRRVGDDKKEEDEDKEQVENHGSR